MSKSSSRKINPTKCPVWLIGPQVSDVYSSYGVGGGTWFTTYSTCDGKYAKLYGIIQPLFIYNMVVEDGGEEDFSKVITRLRECENIYGILLIFSAFINALGILLSPMTNFNADKYIKNLYVYYEKLYEETKTVLEKEDTIKIFVSPEQFKNLKDKNYKRPTNIMKDLNSVEELNEKYKLKVADGEGYDGIHPITPELKKCDATAKSDCTRLFENIKNPIFKPLAQVIACHCSFFKQKLEKITDMRSTFTNPRQIHAMSNGDIAYFKEKHQDKYAEQAPTITIKKYNNDVTSCDKKTYLSQLFEKTCILLYKPYQITPKSDSIEDILEAAKGNDEIARYSCRGYSIGGLRVFQTPILQGDDPLIHANVQVFFLSSDAGQQEKVYLDRYAGPSFQFFTDVVKELLDHKVFIPTETYFNNQRYELNTKFDINKLECYKKLPEAVKNKEGFKQEMTKYFFLFVGNLIHFAVANNIELPFKLSRVYIMKLFKIVDFMEKHTVANKGLKIYGKDNLETQLLLISLYLLEKAPSSYTKTILAILEDPEKLKGSSDPDENQWILALDQDLEDMTDGIRMNGYTTLVRDNHPLYSTNKEKMFYNIINYLYKTALKHYFQDINSETIVSPLLKMNPYLQSFFDGFEYTKRYDNPTEYQMNVLNFSNYSFQDKLSIVRKADIYLSGFGISYEIIKDALLPLIRISHMASLTEPLKMFNPDGKYRDTYEGNVFTTTIAQIETRYGVEYAEKIKSIFLLYRILLSKGKDISKEFIAQYNQKFFNISYNLSSTQRHESMSDEDYHNEFVKLLLKAWSGSPNISTKQYIVFFDVNAKKLPATHTCFNRMDMNKEYTSVLELYNDLVVLVTEGSNFGEALTGGKHIKKKSHSKVNGAIKKTRV